MKRTKRLVVLLLCVCMLIGVLPTGALAVESNLQFKDVSEKSWYYDDVAYVYENNLMNGIGNGKFDPLSSITRGMVVMVLYNMEGKPATAGKNPFQDVGKTKYYTQAVIWAYENNIVNGVSATRFLPEEMATREQLAVMIYNYAKYKGYIDENDSTELTFSDSNKISSWAKKAVGWLFNKGVIRGIGNNKFAPLKTANRAQLAAIIHTYCEAGLDSEETPDDSGTAGGSSGGSSSGGSSSGGSTTPAEDSYAFTINGESFESPANPKEVDGTLYIPVLPVLGEMNYEVNWVSGVSRLSTNRNGKISRATADKTSATVNGTTVTLTEAFTVIDGVPYATAAFFSDMYGISVTADTENKTLTVTAPVPKYINWFDANSFTDVGTWTGKETYLMGIASHSTPQEAQEALQKGELSPKPATLNFNVPKDGTYRLWVEARDFVTNQPGTRYFNAKIDNTDSSVTFGKHAATSGVDGGFYWEDGGTFTLSAGEHTLYLLDTSCFWARCNGIVISEDLTFNPNDDLSNGDVVKNDPSAMIEDPTFPAWAKGSMTTTSDTVAIENDSMKVVFYTGSDDEGHTWVQNEIFIKADGEWKQTKQRNEELGWLMLDAAKSEIAVTQENGEVTFRQTTKSGNSSTTIGTDNFFYTGNPTWFVPKSAKKVNSKQVKLTFETQEKAELTVTFSFDDVCDDVKVALDAKFKEDGNYSFLLYSGDTVEFTDFERVTAPLQFVKKSMPSTPGMVISDPWLYTPMSTFTYPEGTLTDGSKFTSGIVMDPTYITVEDQYTYPDTARYGTVFTTTDGKYRNQMVAPMFGTDNSQFKKNDQFSVAYRIVAQNSDWFDCYKHITQDIYNLGDHRENYYSSLNEAIYNTADMLMDDVYSGWDDEMLGFYNMEDPGLVTQSNPLAIMQQYLLTEDEDFLEERVIPTMAYMLTRKSAHFATENLGQSTTYLKNPPSTIGSPVTMYSTNVYGGMYEMTQGRVPYLLDYAVSNVSSTADLSGIEATSALYKYVSSDSTQSELSETVKSAVVSLADSYMTKASPYIMDKSLMNVFVYNDFMDPTAAFLAAYEVTGEQKYLTAATESAQLLTTSVWTTGYQNDNLTSTTTLTAEDTLDRLIIADQNNANFFWYNADKWRPGGDWTNSELSSLSPQEWATAYPEKTNILDEEVPSWVLAKAGLGTEHLRTPGHGNTITMNAWAGMLEKLTSLTGENFFETMSRNAILGRYSTYPGYYKDRNFTYEMKNEWYVDGPDFTNLYWHHIPIFLAILEDYLINSVQTKAEGNIEFPAVVESGYAYFTTNQYGQEAGSFYGEDDMWLWLDRGIVETTEKNLDYIAARKDGKLGLSFVNEDSDDITTTISLGEKVTGGRSYNGTATMYAADGTTSTVTVTNGKFKLTVPGKGIASVIIAISGVKAPAYAKTYTVSNEIGNTVAEHTDGKAYVLQMTDNEYFSYVYTTRKASKYDETDGIDKLEMTYTIGNGTPVTVTDTTYPFEFIVKVEDEDSPFTYTLTAYKGTTPINLGGGTLKTLAQTATAPKLTISEKTVNQITPIDQVWEGDAVNATALSYSYVGVGDTIRVVANKADFKSIKGCESDVSVNALRGLKIYGVLTHKTTGEKLTFDSWIVGTEARNDTQIVLLCEPTSVCTIGTKYDDYTYKFAVGTKDNSISDFEAALVPEPETDGFKLTVSSFTAGENGLTIVSPKSEFRDNVTADELKDMSVSVALWNKSSEISEVEALSVTLATVETDTVTLNIGYGSKLKKNSAWTNATVKLGAMPVIKAVSAKTGATDYHRFIVTEAEREACPVKYAYSDLVGMDFCARLYGKTETVGIGTEKWLATTVKETSQRNPVTSWNIDVPATDDVPFVTNTTSYNYYSDNYTITIAMKHKTCPTNLKNLLDIAIEKDVDGFALTVNSFTASDNSLSVVVAKDKFADGVTADSLKDMYVSTVLWNEDANASISECLTVSSAVVNDDSVTLNLSYGSKLKKDSAWSGATVKLGALPVIRAVSTVTGAYYTDKHRIIVKEAERTACPIKYTYSDLVGMDFCAKLVGKTDTVGVGSELYLESTVAEVTQRANPSDWNIEVPVTETVPLKSGNYYSENYTITIAMKHKACPATLKSAMSASE